MKNITLALFVFALLSFSINAQTPATTDAKTSNTQTSTDKKPKKQIFRANKTQVSAAQKMLSK